MKTRLQDLLECGGEYDVVVQSLDLSLYQAWVILDNGVTLLCDIDRRPLRSRSLQEMRDLMQPLACRSLTQR
jgi:Family of unknown function (DUF6482)